MRLFIKLASYLLHPIFMPLIGTILYFLITPRFSPDSIAKAKIMAISILTIFIPIVFFFLLKNLKVIDSIHLKKVQERKIPLLFFCIILLTVNNFILQSYNQTELYFFFTCILYSNILALLLAYFKIKASLHLIGISGVVGFILLLSFIYQTNLLYLIAISIFSMGWIAASRLEAKAHNAKEIAWGLFIGLIPYIGIFWF
jgi:membrane-associated HD superfamily phosphohydrolase